MAEGSRLRSWFPGHPDAITINYIGVGVVEEIRRDIFNHRGIQEKIIGVKIENPLSSGPSHAQVQGMSESPVWLAVPIGQSGFVLPDNLYRTIVGSAIYHDVFDMWIGLR
jgi:hypothetical protein